MGGSLVCPLAHCPRRRSQLPLTTLLTLPPRAPACLLAPLSPPTRQQQVPIRTLVVNQVLQHGLKGKYLQTRRADQQRAMERLRHDPQLAALQLIEAPLFDLEASGV